MIGLSSFAPSVLERFPMAPMGQIELHVRDACIELCKKSGWLEREVVIDATHGIRDWPLITDENEEVIRVTQVLLGDRVLKPMRSDYAGRAHGHHCRFDGVGVYWVEALETPDATVHIDVMPDSCHHKLTVRFQVAPTADACLVDKRLLSERKGIAYGALVTLVDDSHKSMLFERRFREHISSLRARRLTGRAGSHGHFKQIDIGI